MKKYFYMPFKDRAYYGITHGGLQVCPEHAFVILRQNDLKLGIHVHCHKVQCSVQKHLARSNVKVTLDCQM